MWTVLLVMMLFVAITKWIMWRLYFLAVLLYYAECGIELPDTKKIREYSMKAAKKSLGIKED
ncbi:MAG: hypothetical protein Q4E24_09700 [bacterium]|nr:hypothetical protein [bacterium]